MNNDNPIRFPGFALKSIVAHTITYSLVGVVAARMLNYDEQFARPEMACWMRQTTDPMIMAGPLFQPIRGLVFALVLFPLREILFTKNNGWLTMWWMLVGLGILSTFGPAPGSIEGMVYTLIPVREQLIGWVEVVPQALLLSAILFYWVKHTEKRWLTWTLAGAFAILVLLSTIGLLVTKSGNA